MSAQTARTRTRLTAEERRRQLIGVGLKLLVTRPIHELSIDEVAAEAGISRGLLFRYFPTKRDYYVAVVTAAAQRVLKHARAPEEARTPRERVRGIVAGFVAFVQRRRENYVALVRTGAGGDELVLEVFENNRRVIGERVLEAVGRPAADPLTRLVVRGWLAMVEEMAIEADDRTVSADELVEFLVASLERMLAPTPDD
ncbi:TetR/AcrR family transcriptional regulator [Streptomyces alkaliterrae]|uniref:TetR family transcriptional regulator n=1 Tax=Streptomyces alkaliterrae TaxID=2213162 RepID=A0A5P0YSW3_9ACTN|nr:TetR/AcrR family transcriptional regulator [Streptomyces alkaliterrae]MBB1255443.1 TetR/AcrR family transcriptional regulator [Streptomyces alkaliterrae]MBB1259971.1 TetR/AcrR family transcriptional regulator [Streptomyces alkaliterrae]MQS03406.1 TetR family transcriptional regulator [Streptomyces alkaliterrae]